MSVEAVVARVEQLHQHDILFLDPHGAVAMSDAEIQIDAEPVAGVDYVPFEATVDASGPAARA